MPDKSWSAARMPSFSHAMDITRNYIAGSCWKKSWRSANSNAGRRGSRKSIRLQAHAAADHVSAAVQAVRGARARVDLIGVVAGGCISVAYEDRYRRIH